jgi:hypothetical protein
MGLFSRNRGKPAAPGLAIKSANTSSERVEAIRSALASLPLADEPNGRWISLNLVVTRGQIKRALSPGLNIPAPDDEDCLMILRHGDDASLSIALFDTEDRSDVSQIAIAAQMCGFSGGNLIELDRFTGGDIAAAAICERVFREVYHNPDDYHLKLEYMPVG